MQTQPNQRTQQQRQQLPLREKIFANLQGPFKPWKSWRKNFGGPHPSQQHIMDDQAQTKCGHQRIQRWRVPQRSEQTPLSNCPQQRCAKRSQQHGSQINRSLVRPTAPHLRDEVSRYHGAQHVKTTVRKVNDARYTKDQGQPCRHHEQRACMAEAIQALNEPKTHSTQCVKSRASTRVVLKVLTTADSSA